MVLSLIIFCLCLLFSLILLRYASFFKLRYIDAKVIPAILLLKMASGAAYPYILPEAGDEKAFLADGLLLAEYLIHEPLTFLKLLFNIEIPADFAANSSYWVKPFSEVLPNDNRSIITVHAIIALFSKGFYLTHLLCFNMLAIAGLTAIYKFLSRKIDFNRQVLFVSVFMIPSVLFWGSALLKEALLLFAFGITLNTLSDFARMPKARTFLLLFFCIAISILIKPYVFLLTIPALIAYFFSLRSPAKKVGTFALVFISIWIMIFSIGKFDKHYDVAGLISDKQSNYLTIASVQNIPLDIRLPQLDGSWTSLAQGIPLALKNGVLEPIFISGNTLLTMLPKLELLLLFLSGIILLLKPGKQHSLSSEYCFALFFVLTLTLFLGYIIPFSGTLLRLKMITLPFLFYLFLAISKLRISK